MKNEQKNDLTYLLSNTTKETLFEDIRNLAKTDGKNLYKDSDIIEYLANAIKPAGELTCKNLCHVPFDQLPIETFYNGYTYFLDTSLNTPYDHECVFLCSNCGHAVSGEDGIAPSILDSDGLDKEFSFCPHCGARVEQGE